MSELRRAGGIVAFAGDVLGTGSLRKSATNSLAWHIGQDIPNTPNKRRGGVVLGATIAPIFYATARDAGTLALQCDVQQLKTGDEIVLDLKSWRIICKDREIAIEPPSPTLHDEYRAGGRLNLIIGKSLTRQACSFLDVPEPDFFVTTDNPEPKESQSYTLAQKMVGRACGLPVVLPRTFCHPKIGGPEVKKSASWNCSPSGPFRQSLFARSAMEQKLSWWWR